MKHAENCGFALYGPPALCTCKALEAKRREIAMCTFCQENKGVMHPPHFASPRCESGKRNHCTCDLCF